MEIFDNSSETWEEAFKAAKYIYASKYHFEHPIKLKNESWQQKDG